jgi:sulfate/thiosulfate transport system ATP-binding protein
VRPHLLDIARLPNGGDHFRARIKHINAAGPLVKVEAITEWGALVHVEMPQDRFRTLQLLKDESVFVIPRDLKVFEANARENAGNAYRV